MSCFGAQLVSALESTGCRDNLIGKIIWLQELSSPFPFLSAEEAQISLDACAKSAVAQPMLAAETSVPHRQDVYPYLFSFEKSCKIPRGARRHPQPVKFFWLPLRGRRADGGGKFG